MKKLLFILMFCALNINAQNTMWVDTVSSGSNTTVEFKIYTANAQPFTAFQVDVQLPAALVFKSGTVVLNPVRQIDHVITATLLTNNKLRIIAYSASRTNFTGSSGSLASFTCTTKTTPGSYPLLLSNALLSNSANQNILTGTVDGLFILTAPDISINPSVIDFGSLPLGEISERNVTVTNNGNLPLNLTKLSSFLSEIKFTDSNQTTIPAYQSINKTVRFTPVIKGHKSGLLQIKNNDPDDSIKTISVTGFAYAVNEIHIGNTAGRSGFEAELEVTINNMEQFSAFEFTLNLPAALRYKNNSAQLFRKTNHIVIADTLSNNRLKVIAYSPNNSFFTGNNGTVLRLKFMVQGQGGHYSIPISGALISDAEGHNIISASYQGSLQIAAPSISYSNSSINFGSVSKFDTAAVLFNVSNSGNDTLKIESRSINNSSFWLKNILPISIPPWNSKNLEVKFHNQVKGNYSAVMKLYHNDVPNNPSSINLSAAVYNPNIISAVSVTGVRGDTMLFPFKINNSEPFTAFQFDVTIPDSIDIINGSLILSERASASHSITSSFVSSNKLRVLAYSLNQSLFGGDSGVVCSFKAVLNKKYGEYPLILSNGLIGNTNNQNIISSTVNGILKILSNSKVTGYFYYDNINSTRLNDVRAYLKQNNLVLDSSLTDNSGVYGFENLPDGNYTISAYSGKVWGGSNSTDALLIRRYTVGLHTLTGLKLQCADVNGNNNVNTSDGLLIKMRVAGLTNIFAINDWQFENSSFIINNNSVVKNIKGITAGDVNGSFNPSLLSKDNMIEVRHHSRIEMTEEEIIYPINLLTDKKIGAITLFLNYPSDVIEIIKLESILPDLIYKIDNGII
ncbi:MAG: choice-of-anchor D domain-containing protein, partial [Ignavibacteriaceae bacterium]|nr:choice-of-anchor D domain-containing protein [Ignavibacteriaceae bacterium]